MRKFESNSGITLIALVITIIVLIILSGVAIFALMGENGIISKADQTRDIQKIAEYQEALEIPKATVKLNTYGLTMDDYWAEINRPGALPIDVTDMERVDSNFGYITVEDKYEYLVEYDEQGDVKITYNGKIEELKPRITSMSITNTTHSVTVNISGKRVGQFEFYITDTEESYGDAKETIESSNYTSDVYSSSYTFDGLTQDKKYYVWIVARNDKGTDERKFDGLTGKMTTLTEEEIEKHVSPTGWYNGDKIVTATINTDKDVSGYKLQYATKPLGDGTSASQLSWFNYKNTGITIEYNSKIFFRLSDGTNITSTMSIDVEDIDKLEPNTFTPTATSTTRSITVTASTTDKDAANGSGKSDGIKYAFKLNNGEYTAYQASGQYTFDELGQTTDYTITVRAKDNANNITEGTITKGTQTIISVGTASSSPTTWTNGEVTITLPTQSGFSTRYTTDGTNPTKNSTLYNGPFKVDSNCTVKFVYTDGTNINTYGSITVANIETTIPTIVSEIAKKSSTSSSIVTTLKAIDIGTGLSKTVYYYKLSTASNYTRTEDVYTPMNGSEKGSLAEQTKEHTFSGLTQGQIYNIYAEVYDVAGNMTRTPETGTIDITTGQVSTLTIETGTTTSNGRPITITAGNTNVSTIRYTLDGTTPTTNSTEYTDSFNITSNCTIKAIAFDSSGQTGAVASLTVTIDLGNAEAAHVRKGYKFRSNNTDQQYESGAMENRTGTLYQLPTP